MSAAAGSLELLRAAERRPVPWKNGGGLTREVAVSPAGSDLTGFDWRVSIAEIRAAGPFSLFEGVDRRMAVLGGRLSLAIEGRPALTLTPETEPVAFPGEIPVAAEPLGGPVTDLNVMTRRGRCSAELMHLTVREPTRLESQEGTTALLLALSEQTLWSGTTSVHLGILDAVLLGPGTVMVEGPASLQLAQIRWPRGLAI